jgi:hypothetical protein
LDVCLCDHCLSLSGGKELKWEFTIPSITH